MLMYPYRLSVTGLNVGYSACLGFTVIYAANIVGGETDCVGSINDGETKTCTVSNVKTGN